MILRDGGRSAGDAETEFTAIERRSEVRGRTERGGGFGIALGGLELSILGESESSVADCNAYVGRRSEGCDEMLLVARDLMLGVSFTGLIDPAMMRSGK
jgi:hypothetical protein